MMIGEQPGDREDRAGRPFVGPAGTLLDRALIAAGIDRREVYLTNAVKHFKWVPAQKKRLHQKPTAREVIACRLWLETEMALVDPEVVVALGATAAQDVMGRSFRVTQSRGQVLATPWARAFIATLHPSALLRAPADRREPMYDDFVSDLKVIAATLRKLAGARRRKVTSV
jgi:uracil-DNA glycosylase family protein